MSFPTGRVGRRAISRRLSVSIVAMKKKSYLKTNIERHSFDDDYLFILKTVFDIQRKDH